MVSSTQVEFFSRLLEEKDFGDQSAEELHRRFCRLSKKSGSAWIEKALSLPRRDESQDPVETPPF